MSQSDQDSLTSRVGVVSAAVTGASLIASAFYDWGFFFAIGSSFAEVPTTISDHLRSWLDWLPAAAIVIFILLFKLVVESRDSKRSITEEKLSALISGQEQVTEEKLSTLISEISDLTQARKRRERVFYVMGGVGVLVFIAWVLFGGSVTLLIFSVAMCWSSLVYFVDVSTLECRFSLPQFFAFSVVPVILMLFFSLGYSAAKSDRIDPAVTHKLLTKNFEAKETLIEAVMLRHFEKFLVIRTSDNVIMWVHTDEIRAIEQKTKKPSFRGIACYLREDWCLEIRADKPAG